MDSLFQALHNACQAFSGELFGCFLGMIIPSPCLKRPLGTVFRVGGIGGAKVPMAWEIQELGGRLTRMRTCQVAWCYFFFSSVTTQWMIASRSCSRPKRCVGDLKRSFFPLNFRFCDRRLDFPCVSISATSRMAASEIVVLRYNQGMRASMDIRTVVLNCYVT